MINEIKTEFGYVINWQQKLTSRKWWGFVSGMVVACLMLFNVENDIIVRAVALVAAIANFAIYTWGETTIDAARIRASSDQKLATLRESETPETDPG